MFYDEGLGAAMEIAAIMDQQKAMQAEVDRLNAAQFQQREIPVTLVEHMTDPRAAQLQMLFASLDERGKKTIVALAATMVKLHKDSEHG